MSTAVRSYAAQRQSGPPILRPETLKPRPDDLRQVHIDWFRSQGVSALQLAKTWCGEIAPLTVDRVVFHRGWFEFAAEAKASEREKAVAAFLIPTRDTAGDVADVVAWHPKSGRLATLCGRVALLGEEQAFAPRLNNLMLYASPLEWLRAWREGVVIVDQRATRSILLDAGPIQVATVEEGIKLHKLLTKVDLPQILVSQPAEVQAA